MARNRNAVALTAEQQQAIVSMNKLAAAGDRDGYNAAVDAFNATADNSQQRVPYDRLPSFMKPAQ